ncbi:Pre-rRNA-processing protein [Wickerhamomyces ciferrii]|uniref:Pre-rRNA-processing protein n=1 Tax=Wickerhamomyces ciferrii (strain ATCC 14091 / BCRC 22168 / CBS 111 / JCM 3599 / NBRC 0793 / NRRL Y-1031 F-60-10) TaxID=1206466 RepID=K0KG43_WICCF|nr:Pre-rRNA-processing protein [Wickerhamomyces ciferrii]CCH44125.1 Pre-rRNA-processing protein [Wickerhamomyces ciferrii]
MGSTKKQKEKKKDFQLKVGKTKAKPSNFTDTSFVAKILSKRNLDQETDLIKRLSLVKHHASTTRKETLIYIQEHLPENPSLYKQILNAVVPLIIDQSRSVRSALIDLLVHASEKQPNLMELHTRSIILFVHSAMTHIVPDIRNDSTKFLDVLIKFGPDSLVRSAWVKTLKSYFGLLSWTLNDTKQSVSLAITSSSVTNSSNKTKKQSLDSLIKFINTGCFPDESASGKQKIVLTSHPLTTKYLIPVTPQPFAHLKLFTVELSSKTNKNTTDNTIDLNTISCEDYLTRKKVLIEYFIPQIRKNSKNLVKEGGEVGKSAHTLLSVCDKVEESMKSTDL